MNRIHLGKQSIKISSQTWDIRGWLSILIGVPTSNKSYSEYSESCNKALTYFLFFSYASKLKGEGWVPGRLGQCPKYDLISILMACLNCVKFTLLPPHIIKPIRLNLESQILLNIPFVCRMRIQVQTQIVYWKVRDILLLLLIFRGLNRYF